MKTENVQSPIESQEVQLIGDQVLRVERESQTSNSVQLIGSDGRVTLRIEVTEEGPVLHCEGTALQIKASGNIAIDAKEVAIHGREGMSLTSGGDITLHSSKDIHSNARIQNITAELGNTNIKANDDVTMDGERIRMNC